MKASPRTIRRPNDVPRDEVVIPLPEARLLRLIARSFLLFAVVLSLPWLRSALISDSSAEIGSNSAKDDELFYMPKLVQDMKAYGLIQPEKRSLFLGNPGIHASLLRSNGVSCLPERNIPRIGGPQSLDFVFLVGGGGFNDAYFRIMDSTIKVGGVAAFRLGTHPVKPFNLPANYRMIYIQNIGRTIIAVKKLYHDNSPPGSRRRRRRRLLSVSKAMEVALRALEDALLEPPVAKKYRRIRYLPELIGEYLDEYPRRVFVDIGSPGRVGAEAWFRNKYPRNKEFEIVRVDLVDFPAGAAVGSGEWLRNNVRKEEYVVVKADAEAVEAMTEGEVIELVDELFLECKIDLENGEFEEEGKRRKRAYWECLSLFGKLRESGVAVHQWWG